jgi:hypothetical protein
MDKSTRECETDGDLKKKLDMPGDASLRKVTITGGHYGPKFRNYRVEIVGREVDHMPEPCPWPCVLIEPGDGGSGRVRNLRVTWCLEPGSRLYESNPIRRSGLRITQIWRTRVRYGRSAAFAEWQWHPAKGFSISVRGLESVAANRRVQEGRRALDGAALIQISERRVRPAGSFKIPAQGFADQLSQRYREYARFNGGELPSKKLLAEEMGISESTLSRRMKDQGIRWPPT